MPVLCGEGAAMWQRAVSNAEKKEKKIMEKKILNEENQNPCFSIISARLARSSS